MFLELTNKNLDNQLNVFQHQTRCGSRLSAMKPCCFNVIIVIETSLDSALLVK